MLAPESVRSNFLSASQETTAASHTYPSAKYGAVRSYLQLCEFKSTKVVGSSCCRFFAWQMSFESQILSYYEMGSVLVAYDGDLVVGMAQIMNDDRTIEIISLAVSPERQGQGIGIRLIEEAVSYCRMNHISRLVVSTGSWETDNLVFYLRRGFRIFNVVRDYFTLEKGYAEASSRSSSIGNEPVGAANAWHRSTLYRVWPRDAAGFKRMTCLSRHVACHC